MPDSNLPGRLANGLRFLILGGVVIALTGVCAHFQGWPWLQATLGPTAYVLVAHPSSDAARVRNAVIGHTSAIGAGLLCLVIFGLWTHPSVPETKSTTLAQVFACALALGLTLFLLEVLDAHHAPAGATTLLITTGIARPGHPLFGLALGLALVIGVGAIVTKLPFRRQEVAKK